jgi:hypothetical protein
MQHMHSVLETNEEDSNGQSCIWSIYIAICWDIWAWSNRNSEIPMNFLKPIHVSKEWKWETFSPPLLVEVNVAMFEYGSPLHYLKSSVRRKEADTRPLALWAGPGKGRRRSTSAWMVRWNLAPCLTGHGLFLQIYFLVTWPSSLRIGVLNCLDRDRNTKSC